jgi:hypothetical protein
MNNTTKKKIGRPAGEIIYKDVTYKDKHYIVAKIFRNNEPIAFVFDKEDEEKVKSHYWCCTSAGYIASSKYIDGVKKLLLLHRFILDVPHFPGKGAKETIDHINRNPLDNRKENLRILTQTEQNINTKTRKRAVKLPEGCMISPDELPRHIWYIKPNGGHGDRFAIELKTEHIVWKTTSSKQVSLYEKLEEAKQKLNEFYSQYPHLDPKNTELTLNLEELTKHFQEIIVLSDNLSLKINN